MVLIVKATVGLLLAEEAASVVILLMKMCRPAATDLIIIQA